MGNEGKAIEESGLKFYFSNEARVIKFDESSFYRKHFNKLPESKGVDIWADTKETIQLIEIKNCSGHEAENMWRTSVDNRKRDSAPDYMDIENRDSLDIEVAKKVAASIACTYGAWMNSEKMQTARELLDLWKGLSDQKLLKNKKKLLIVLFLEGDFVSNCSKTRSKKMMMQRIQESIYTKLGWLNCQVSVVDTNTYKKRYFQVSETGRKRL